MEKQLYRDPEYIGSFNQVHLVGEATAILSILPPVRILSLLLLLRLTLGTLVSRS